MHIGRGSCRSNTAYRRRLTMTVTMVRTTLKAAHVSQPPAVNAVISACKKSAHAVTRVPKMNTHATVVLMTTMVSVLIKGAQNLLAVSWQSAMIMIELGDSGFGTIQSGGEGQMVTTFGYYSPTLICLFEIE
jgi:hypothetical protein